MQDNEAEWIKPDLADQDLAISFVWGADYAAGACIGLISVALIDNCNALIYYMDDQMKYTREMLLNDTPQFLAELGKGSESNSARPLLHDSDLGNREKRNSFWQNLKRMFK